MACTRTEKHVFLYAWVGFVTISIASKDNLPRLYFFMFYKYADPGTRSRYIFELCYFW